MKPLWAIHRKFPILTRGFDKTFFFLTSSLDIGQTILSSFLPALKKHLT